MAQPSSLLEEQIPAVLSAITPGDCWSADVMATIPDVEGGSEVRCPNCRSTAVQERPERTAQGYRRFRCLDCTKQFNERSSGLLNRTQYPSDVIALVVLWRLPSVYEIWLRCS